jgi:hypothetical protein
VAEKFSLNGESMAIDAIFQKPASRLAPKSNLGVFVKLLQNPGKPNQVYRRQLAGINWNTMAPPAANLKQLTPQRESV